MRYFGTKTTTREEVFNIISERVPRGVICDPFGGVANIGSFFKSKGYSVWSGDILTFAHYFQIARVKRNKPSTFPKLRKALGVKSSAEVVELLNKGRVTQGWLVREYAEKRHFFTRENAVRIEACRLMLAKWSSEDLVSKNERAVLLASLINSADKVANTAGTYYAYLKKWDRKALHPFRFELIPHTPGNSNCQCFLTEAKNLISKRAFDILYLDPPHNERNYASYYHLPENLALQRTPKTSGKSGISKCTTVQSEFNNKKKASKALEEILRRAEFKLVVLHYSDSGIIDREDAIDILGSYGKLEEYVIDGLGYTTSREKRKVKHRLYVVENA